MSGITQKSKDAFWAVVEDCLIEIHKLPPSRANQLCDELRRKIDSKTIPQLQNPIPDLFYHVEPFDVASDIAQNHLKIKIHRNTYNDILNRHNW